MYINLKPFQSYAR